MAAQALHPCDGFIIKDTIVILIALNTWNEAFITVKLNGVIREPRHFTRFFHRMQYYGDTYYHPNSQSWYTTESLAHLMAFDAEDHVDLIDQPLLMIAGEHADTRYMSDAVFEKAVNAKVKEFFPVPDANHIETYWKEPFVSQESAKLVEFFGANL